MNLVKWSLLAQEKILEALRELNGPTWGYDRSENLGFVADLDALTSMSQYEHLKLQKKVISAQGIELQITPEKTISSLSALTEAIHLLLNALDEDLFILLPLLDTNALTYWFVVGTTTHGHIGQIVLQRTDLSHIDLSTMK